MPILLNIRLIAYIFPIQNIEKTKNFRLNIMLNIQNAIRIPFFITTFATPIGGSV